MGGVARGGGGLWALRRADLLGRAVGTTSRSRVQQATKRVRKGLGKGEEEGKGSGQVRRAGLAGRVAVTTYRRHVQKVMVAAVRKAVGQKRWEGEQVFQ